MQSLNFERICAQPTYALTVLHNDVYAYSVWLLVGIVYLIVYS
jgi:hypothetical protein